MKVMTTDFLLLLESEERRAMVVALDAAVGFYIAGRTASDIETGTAEAAVDHAFRALSLLRDLLDKAAWSSGQ